MLSRKGSGLWVPPTPPHSENSTALFYELRLCIRKRFLALKRKFENHWPEKWICFCYRSKGNKKSAVSDVKEENLTPELCFDLIGTSWAIWDLLLIRTTPPLLGPLHFIPSNNTHTTHRELYDAYGKIWDSGLLNQCMPQTPKTLSRCVHCSLWF